MTNAPTAALALGRRNEGGRALLSRRAISNRTWKGLIMKCLSFLQICLILEMIKGFRPKHRIKTFYRHEDWSSYEGLNAVLELFRSGWNKDQSEAGEVKCACAVSVARHNQVHRVEGTYKDVFSIANTKVSFSKHVISTWWVLDHISNRWLNKYPEPDRMQFNSI